MRDLGDAWLDEMQRWTINDQVSLPYLFWRDGIQPGTFGIDLLGNDMVAWMAHAQELRDHHRTILDLESRLIETVGRADHFEAMYDRTRSDLERVRGRRSVRLALGTAALTKPFRRRS